MTAKHLTIADLLPRHQAEVMRQIENGKPIGIARAEEVRKVEIVSMPKTMRQSTKGPNKTEAAFDHWFRANYPTIQFEREGITLRLANGLRYTPDYAAFNPDRSIVLYEVKGAPGAQIWDDSICKIKMAASKFPTIEFWLVRPTDKSKTQWNFERVYP